MMRYGTNLFGYVSLKLLLHGFRGLSVAKAQPVRYSEYVGVYGDYGFVIDDGSDDIGRLPAHSAERHQSIDVRRYLSVESLHESARHLHQVLCLRIRVGYGADYVLYFGWRCLGESLCIGIGFEKTGSHHIYSLVGALGRQKYGAD